MVFFQIHLWSVFNSQDLRSTPYMFNKNIWTNATDCHMCSIAIWDPVPHTFIPSTVSDCLYILGLFRLHFFSGITIWFLSFISLAPINILHFKQIFCSHTQHFPVTCSCIPNNEFFPDFAIKQWALRYKFYVLH